MLKHRTTFQNIKQHWIRITISVVVMIFIIVVVLGYCCGWEWVGVKVSQDCKTLWDWLDLVGVPVGLALGIWLLGKKQADVEQQIAKDKRQQEALQYYFAQMTELLSNSPRNALEFPSPKNGEPVNNFSHLARWHTLAVLRAIDGRRKGQVLSFLFERGLIHGGEPIIDLTHAELKEADLIVGQPFHWGKKEGKGEWDGRILSDYIHENHEAPRWSADLREINLCNTDLFCIAFILTNLDNAYLRDAYLQRARLMGASLRDADLSGADLRKANLCGVDLRGANLTGTQLSDAIYDESTQFPDGFDIPKEGAKLISQDKGFKKIDC